MGVVRRARRREVNSLAVLIGSALMILVLQIREMVLGTEAVALREGPRDFVAAHRCTHGASA